MKKIFVCLANSKKYGERCIAGIELNRDEKGSLYLVKENGKPKWIRPVSNAEHGEVASHLISHIKLNDIVEIDITESCPRGYQSENVLFDPNSISVKSQISLNNQNLDKLAVQLPNLFGNRGKAIPEDKIIEVSNSLIMIKVVSPTIYVRTEYEKNQLRIKFSYSQNEYDLPITDLNFSEKYTLDETVLNTSSHIYLTISLGVLYEGWYYKLVAGIIYI
jgi:hypothetical protein